MHDYGGHGCFRVGMLGVYGCGWVQWDPLEDWGPEIRQGGTQMVFAGTGCARQEQENSRKMIRTKGVGMITRSTGGQTVHTLRSESPKQKKAKEVNAKKR